MLTDGSHAMVNPQKGQAQVPTQLTTVVRLNFVPGKELLWENKKIISPEVHPSLCHSLFY